MAKHHRFLTAFLLGLAAFALSHVWPLHEHVRILAGVVVFFTFYLVLMWRFAGKVTPDQLRSRAAENDEGIVLILLLALGSIVVSLYSITVLLTGKGAANFEHVLALGSVPLGWATLQTVVAFHYAHLFYRPDEDGEGGLGFPETDEPGAWEFLYFAFGIGMAAQVSDVTAQTKPMRQMVMFHSIGSFFYNAVILALAVNAFIAFRTG